MAYNDYLKSKHWKQTRERRLESRPYCKVCGSDYKLHVHHKFYTDKSGKSILHKERNEDLVTVCPSCHSFIHRYFGNCKKLNKKILRVKRLIELGATKKKAFWVVSQAGLFSAVIEGVNNKNKPSII